MARQVYKRRLDHFFSQLRRADLTKCRRIDKVEVAMNDLGEGIFGVLRGVAGEQFQIGFVHFYNDNGARETNTPKKLCAGSWLCPSGAKAPSKVYPR